MSIVVMVDGGASLPKSILKRKDVVVLPLIDERVEKISMINFENVFSSYTSLIHNPLKDEVVKRIKKYIDNGYDVLYITISSRLSKHYNEILELTSSFDSSAFKVIDSLNMCSGEGLLVNLALNYIDKGYRLKQVYNCLERLRHDIKSSYIIGDFDTFYFQDKCDDVKNKYLEYYGRYPLVELHDGEGKITFSAKTLEAAYQILENNISDNLDDNSDIFISGVNNKYMQTLKKNLIKNYSNINVVTTQANPLLKICLGDVGVGYSIVSRESYS